MPKTRTAWTPEQAAIMRERATIARRNLKAERDALLAQVSNPSHSLAITTQALIESIDRRIRSATSGKLVRDLVAARADLLEQLAALRGDKPNDQPAKGSRRARPGGQSAPALPYAEPVAIGPDPVETPPEPANTTTGGGVFSPEDSPESDNSQVTDIPADVPTDD